jgi:hypothetical protein
MICSARDCARDLCTCTWTPSPVCGGFSVDAEICDTRFDFSGLVKLADNVESRCTVLKRFSFESEFKKAAGAGSGFLGAGAGLFPPPLLMVA